MAIDQITVEYTANVDKLVASQRVVEQGFIKVDQAATKSSGKINTAFQKSGGIIENLNAHLQSLERRRDKAMNPATVQIFNKRIDETRAKIQALTGQVEKSGGSMISTFRSIAASVGIAFGVQQILRFGKELINLALDAEEVKIAFKNLNNSTILDEVKKAVGGTVDEVTLMQSILKAENLGIPLKNLATLFEFAERKAGALGLTTEATFETIIQAIGAKSPKAFTSLGISVFTVQEKMKGLNFETASLADVANGMGEIFEAELAKMGENVDSNSDKVGRLRAEWTDFKTDIGGGLVQAILGLRDAMLSLKGGVDDTIDAVSLGSGLFNNLFRSILNAADPLGIFHSRLKDTDETLKRLGFSGSWADILGPEDDLTRYTESITSMEDRLHELNLEISKTTLIETRNKLVAQAKLLSDQITIATGGETEAMKANSAATEKAATEAKRLLEEWEKLKLSSAKRALEINALMRFDSNIEDRVLFFLAKYKGALDDLQKESEDTEIPTLPFASAEATEKLQEQLAQRKKVIGEDLKGRIQLLENEKAEELRIAESLGQNKLLIEEKYEQLIKQAKLEAAASTISDLDNIYQGLLSIIAEVNSNRLNLELEAIEKQKESQLEALDLQLENEKLTAKQRKDLIKQREQIELSSQERIKAAQEAAAKDQLKFTIAGIVLSQGAAIASAIAGAIKEGGGPLKGLAILAITLPLILAGFAQALAAANSVQLAEGEVDIRGPGTKKSDSIPARLSRGESVVTADGTSIDPDMLRAMNKGQDEFMKHIQVNYVWPYMEAMIKANSRPEKIGFSFTDKNLLKELRTGNKLQVKSTNALLRAMQGGKSYRGERN